MTRAPAQWLLACACVVVAACGFQLRGSDPVHPALSPLAIDAVRSGSVLLPPLRRALADAGVEVVQDAARARVTLHINADMAGERVIAVTPQGQPREAEVFYTVEFQLVDARGDLLLDRAVTLRREFAISERDILGKTHEADVLADALVHDMVRNMVRQLAAVTP
ncbi:MAG: LPS assembly lipoprotein LptE [Gammaproteobacteria bacterium]